MQYYTIKEAADILKMHPSRVRKAILDHKLGALRKGPGGKYLITPKQIEAYLVPAGADWEVAKKKK